LQNPDTWQMQDPDAWQMQVSCLAGFTQSLLDIRMWRDNLKLLDLYKGISSAPLSLGDTCNLWYDLWAGQVFQ
jgi:hypothetical protein